MTFFFKIKESDILPVTYKYRVAILGGWPAARIPTIRCLRIWIWYSPPGKENLPLNASQTLRFPGGNGFGCASQKVSFQAVSTGVSEKKEQNKRETKLNKNGHNAIFSKKNDTMYLCEYIHGKHMKSFPRPLITLNSHLWFRKLRVWLLLQRRIFRLLMVNPNATRGKKAWLRGLGLAAPYIPMMKGLWQNVRFLNSNTFPGGEIAWTSNLSSHFEPGNCISSKFQISI